MHEQSTRIEGIEAEKNVSIYHSCTCERLRISDCIVQIKVLYACMHELITHPLTQLLRRPR